MSTPEGENVSIDGSDLISVAIDFKKLQLFLKSYDSRISALEENQAKVEPPIAVAEAGDNEKGEEKIEEKPEELAANKDKEETEYVPKDVYDKDMAAMQKEIDELKELIPKKENVKTPSEEPAAEEKASINPSDKIQGMQNDLDDLKEKMERLAANQDRALPTDFKEKELPRKQEGVEGHNLEDLEAKIADCCKQCAEIVPLREDLNELDNKVQQGLNEKAPKKQVDDLVEKMDAHDASIGNLQDGIGGLNARLKTLEGMVSLLQPKGTEGSDDLSSFTDTMRDLLEKQSAMDSKLNNVADDLAKTKDTVDDLLNKPADAKDEYPAKVVDERLEKRISDLAAACPTHNDLNAALKLVPKQAPEAAVVSQTAAPGLTQDEVEKMINDALQGTGDQIQKLQNQIASLAEIPASSGGESSVTPQQFALVKSAVESLENLLGDTNRKLQELVKTVDANKKENQEALQGVDQSLNNNRNEIKALGNEASTLRGLIRDLDAAKTPNERVDELEKRLNSAQADKGEWKGINDVNKRVDGLQKMFSVIDAKVSALTNEKIPKEAVAQLQRDVDKLRHMISSLQSSGGPQPAAAGATVGSEIVDDLNDRISDLMKQLGEDREWAKGQVVEIRATIDHVHHSKADASLVANKAERDYVENAMEKLMREVEQVLNATNAGLIDTLDKSLNILRDMIDGKATKQDIAKLQTLIGEDSTSAVPEGLTGYKSYRCLGCNRPMEDMRQRPMGASSSAFVNRIPGSNTRGKPLTPSAPAGYLTSPTSQ